MNEALPAFGAVHPRTRDHEYVRGSLLHVGTAFMLAELGEVEWDADTATVRFEEKAGTVPVRIVRGECGYVFCGLTAPEPLSLGPELPVDEVTAAAGLEAGDIVTAVHRPGCMDGSPRSGRRADRTLRGGCTGHPAWPVPVCRHRS